MTDAGYLYTGAQRPDYCSACLTATAHNTCQPQHNLTRQFLLVEHNGLWLCPHCDRTDLMPPPRILS